MVFLCTCRHACELKRGRQVLEDGADQREQRKAAMHRVLTQQRASQQRAKVDHHHHFEKRMNAILSLRKSIATSEVWVVGFSADMWVDYGIMYVCICVGKGGGGNRQTKEDGRKVREGVYMTGD